MKVPAIRGVIRRRVLVNFRVDRVVMQRQLPPGLSPKLHEGDAIAGICLIRLEQIRPKGLPAVVTFSSENAAHRVAVEWQDSGVTREGVYIPRRDTSSFFNRMAGGRLFPGEYHAARFEVSETSERIAVSMRSDDDAVAVEVAGTIADQLPESSGFRSLEEASAFFEGGALGFSATADRTRLDGVVLKTDRWAVEPLEIERVFSSYFENHGLFPKGSVRFDCALLMRDIGHEWHAAESRPLDSSAT